MGGLSAARRRPFNTRARPMRGEGSPSISGFADAEEPPKKRRRYIPGGPGGGGRWMNSDGKEELVFGAAPGALSPPSKRESEEGDEETITITPMSYERPARPVRSGRTERYDRPRRESRRDRTSTRPRYSSAAAAAAAVVQGDGFKPREERGWEEFHQDLDIDATMPIFTADEIDGTVQAPDTPTMLNGDSPSNPGDNETDTPGVMKEVEPLGDSQRQTPATARRRRPGRPPRRADSMLKAIGTPNMPKIIPLPGPNPRERLTLPKPSFKMIDTFSHYEETAEGQKMNYVDKSMANVGYQESDVYLRSARKLIRLEQGTIEEELDMGPVARADGELNAAIGATGVGKVEYDMDEQDKKWLDDYNERRRAEDVHIIKPAIFEITMTKIEKEWHALERRIPKPNPKPPQTHRPRSSSAAAVNGEPQQGEEQDSKCAICDDGDCENTNAIVFCDGCDLAVHQECYGVPFIPEGQWLCRRCHLIGRGTPTCIFCPNTDGAFKQTNSSRWAHLLCAIWIPEVSLGNSTFMEPVMDVEKVPKQRWRLQCYICRQRMGACIQCGNKNCFQAFHVTCARRAKLFLQMKSSHGGVPQLLDASVLKAFCDKHVPDDWRREQSTDEAMRDAMHYYRLAMRGRQWADSQQAALNMTAPRLLENIVPSIEAPLPKISLIMGSNKNRKKVEQKKLWKLPSGAPVIPSVVYDSVESSLQRFTVRKRREFAADMCKYWTLKREAKRGAALIKRLQLQMETFSSMEVTRRDFAAMGAIGRPRLQRRIDFADARLQDVGKLREICQLIKDREEKRVEDAEILKELVDTIYLPVSAMLGPIMDRVNTLGSKGTFKIGLDRIRERLEERFYTSISQFSTDLSIVFSTVIGMSTLTDTTEVHSQLTLDKGRKDLDADQKQKRALAKRIIKAIQPALEDATRKESELNRRPFEQELQALDALLERSLPSRRDSVSSDLDATEQERPTTNGQHDEHDEHDQAIADVQKPLPDPSHQPTPEETSGADLATVIQIEPVSSTDPPAHDLVAMPANSHALNRHAAAPPTPPLSATADLQPPLAHGGVPWYMDSFDPSGTTVYDQRWTGRSVARGMSEELSDLDEEELDEMVDEDGNIEMAIDDEDSKASKQAKTKKNAQSRRRKKQFWA